MEARRIFGFEATTLIQESASSLVYRAHDAGTGAPVILKMLKEALPTPAESIRYRTEFETAQRLRFPGAIRVLELRPHQSTWLMVIEDFGGTSLDRVVVHNDLTLEDTLRIGIAVAVQLAGIHGAGVIHKDINPANLVWNAAEGVLKVIDFGRRDRGAGPGSATSASRRRSRARTKTS